MIKDRLYTKSGRLSISKINSAANIKLKDRVIKQTDFLHADCSYSERIYCILNGIDAAPVCEITGEMLSWNPNTHQYCSSSRRGSYIKQKTKKKKLSRQLKEIYKEQNNLILDTYNSETYKVYTDDELYEFINDRFKSRVRVNSAIRRNNINELCNILKRTDSQFLPVNSIEDFKWGERFYIIREGMCAPPMCVGSSDPAPFENSKVGYRRQATNEDRIENYLSNILPKIKSQGFEILNKRVKKLKGTQFELKCLKCEEIHSRELTNGRWKSIYCPGCYGKAGRSKHEDDIISYISSIYDGEILKNYKHPNSTKEIDIYIPALSVGIEYNGILWHSFGSSYPNNIDTESENKYHIMNKMSEYKSLGIRIINIFEHEWLFKRDIVESMIMNKTVGITPVRIFARKCEVQKLECSAAREFIEENHIQGKDLASIYYGLIYNDEIVSVMSFGKRKITGSAPHYELIRFCNKLNTTVIGGATKLFKHSKQELKQITDNIITYADLRWSDGNLYDVLGFTFKHDSMPNYWYIKSYQVYHRSKFQKHKLKNMDGYDERLTERDIMYYNGYRRLYDCGNKVYEIKL